MKKPAQHGAVLGNCFQKYVGNCEGPKAYGHLFNFVQRQCKPVLHCPRVAMIEGCCHLLDGMMDVADLATAMAQCIGRDHTKGQIYNIQVRSTINNQF